MTTMTTTDQKSLYPDQVFTYTEVVPEALLLNPAVATMAGEIEGDKPMVRVPYIKTDPVATFVAEGAEIPDGVGMLDEVTLTTGKLALLIQRITPQHIERGEQYINRAIDATTVLRLKISEFSGKSHASH